MQACLPNYALIMKMRTSGSRRFDQSFNLDCTRFYVCVEFGTKLFVQKYLEQATVGPIHDSPKESWIVEKSSPRNTANEINNNASSTMRSTEDISITSQYFRKVFRNPLDRYLK